MCTQFLARAPKPAGLATKPIGLRRRLRSQNFDPIIREDHFRFQIYANQPIS